MHRCVLIAVPGIILNAITSMSLLALLSEDDTLDIARASLMALVHDLAEAEVGGAYHFVVCC